MMRTLDRGALAQFGNSASGAQPFDAARAVAEGSTMLWRTSLAQSIGSDVARHAAMLDATGFAGGAVVPTKYVKFVAAPRPSSSSSQQPVASAAAEYYAGLEEQLAELEVASKAPDAPVEGGAVASAMSLIRELRRLNYAPPELTWHGGDTVVMLWAFGNTTCAVTVTDGEVGYVVRRGRKRLRMRDSIKLEDFKVISIG